MGRLSALLDRYSVVADINASVEVLEHTLSRYAIRSHAPRRPRHRPQASCQLSEMLPLLTTFVHFSISAAMNLPNSSGVLCVGSMPISPVRRERTSGS